METLQGTEPFKPRADAGIAPYWTISFRAAHDSTFFPLIPVGHLSLSLADSYQAKHEKDPQRGDEKADQIIRASPAGNHRFPIDLASLVPTPMSAAREKLQTRQTGSIPFDSFSRNFFGGSSDAARLTPARALVLALAPSSAPCFARRYFGRRGEGGAGSFTRDPRPGALAR